MQQADPAPAASAATSASNSLPDQQIRTWNADPDQPTPDDASVSAQLGFNDLSEKQVQALDLMFSGMRLTQIATTLEVNRTTIHRWRTQHPAFIAAYNRRHKEHLDAASIRIAQLLDASLAQFEAIFAGQKTKPRRVLAAHRILKTFASRRLLQGPGPTNGPAVLRHIALQRRAELCAPLTSPVTQDELTRVLDELQYELRDIVVNKYSHTTDLPAPSTAQLPAA